MGTSRSQSLLNWIEQQYVALELAGLPDECANQLATLRRDYADTRTVFGLEASDEDIAEKQRRLAAIASSWLDSLKSASLAVRHQAAQCVDFLSPVRQDAPSHTPSGLLELLQGAFEGRWRYHGFAEALSDEQQRSAQVLQQLGELPESFVPLVTQIGRVWLLGSNAHVSSGNYASYSGAFGDPGPALQEASLSSGVELFCGIDGLLPQRKAAAPDFRLGGGELGQRRFEIRATRAGLINVSEDGHGSKQFPNLEGYLHAVAGVLAGADGSATTGMPVEAALEHRLLPPKKFRDQRPEVALLLGKQARIGAREVRFKEEGPLELGGEIVVWHPVDEFEQAPRFRFKRPAIVRNAWLGNEHLATVLHDGAPVSTWYELGDASTDTTQLYLLRKQDLNRLLKLLEPGDVAMKRTKTSPFQTMPLGRGTFAVLHTNDGNAQIHAGLDGKGVLACIVIVTGQLEWSARGYQRPGAASALVSAAPAQSSKT